MIRPGHRDTGTPGHRDTGTPGHRDTGTPGHRDTGTPGHRGTGMRTSGCRDAKTGAAVAATVPSAGSLPKAAIFRNPTPTRRADGADAASGLRHRTPDRRDADVGPPGRRAAGTRGREDARTRGREDTVRPSR
ncbi:hypothetical protein Ae168Ps1_4023 [Pseudonocardia sp. Ae168_Ps1]|nr:hypothetical protein Ae168Ps1_4023 [Pseudonocardia sp. Ae168_Ps1]OLL95712.1 hypothetical protein Ae356Ps1_5609 [Pseudonocardia sp. Ae356_Ps1]